ncbi:MAG: hypothetical protein C0392_04595 [Syntrophus sp. (in: bacteria)]|nr:hypothetical protein [Syntrophus sp. (in: bacteria)]
MKDQDTKNLPAKGRELPGWIRAFVETPFGAIQEYGPPGSLSDHATRFMINHIRVPKDARACEPGCGTGVLALYMAMAGAGAVSGADLNEASLRAARYNASINKIRNVKFVKGDLLMKVSGPLDLIVALLPHKPAPGPFNKRYYGGPDGTDLLLPLIDQAASRLIPGGHLYLYLNSIANPRRVLVALNERFQVRIAGEKRRYFTREEFDGLLPGMFDYLCTMKTQGTAEFHEDTSGFYFTARVYEAQLL